MAKRERPDPDLLHRSAQEAVLRAIEHEAEPGVLVEAAASYDIRAHFTADVAMLDLAVTALELAVPSGAARVPYEGLRERYLPEWPFRGKTEHRRSQYALYAAASMRGGVMPDLLDDAGWWQRPLVDYAALALLIYVRVAAERLGSTAAEVARSIADRHGLDLRASREDGVSS